MCSDNSSFNRTAVEIAEAQEREARYAIADCLRLAHNSEADPETVVARARVYRAFLAEGF